MDSQLRATRGHEPQRPGWPPLLPSGSSLTTLQPSRTAHTPSAWLSCASYINPPHFHYHHPHPYRRLRPRLNSLNPTSSYLSTSSNISILHAAGRSSPAPSQTPPPTTHRTMLPPSTAAAAATSCLTIPATRSAVLPSPAPTPSPSSAPSSTTNLTRTHFPAPAIPSPTPAAGIGTDGGTGPDAAAAWGPLSPRTPIPKSQHQQQHQQHPPMELPLGPSGSPGQHADRPTVAAVGEYWDSDVGSEFSAEFDLDADSKLESGGQRQSMPRQKRRKRAALPALPPNVPSPSGRPQSFPRRAATLAHGPHPAVVMRAIKRCTSPAQLARIYYYGIDNGRAGGRGVGGRDGESSGVNEGPGGVVRGGPAAEELPVRPHHLSHLHVVALLTHLAQLDAAEGPPAAAAAVHPFRLTSTAAEATRFVGSGLVVTEAQAQQQQQRHEESEVEAVDVAAFGWEVAMELWRRDSEHDEDPSGGGGGPRAASNALWAAAKLRLSLRAGWWTHMAARLMTVPAAAAGVAAGPTTAAARAGAAPKAAGTGPVVTAAGGDSTAAQAATDTRIAKLESPSGRDVANAVYALGITVAAALGGPWGGVRDYGGRTGGVGRDGGWLDREGVASGSGSAARQRFASRLRVAAAGVLAEPGAESRVLQATIPPAFPFKDCNAQELSCLLYGVALLGLQPPGDWLAGSYSPALLRVLPGAQPQVVSTVLWALQTLHNPPPPALATALLDTSSAMMAATAAAATATTLTPPSLASLLARTVRPAPYHPYGQSAGTLPSNDITGAARTSARAVAPLPPDLLATTVWSVGRLVSRGTLTHGSVAPAGGDGTQCRTLTITLGAWRTAAVAAVAATLRSQLSPGRGSGVGSRSGGREEATNTQQHTRQLQEVELGEQQEGTVEQRKEDGVFPSGPGERGGPRRLAVGGGRWVIRPRSLAALASGLALLRVWPPGPGGSPALPPTSLSPPHGASHLVDETRSESAYHHIWPLLYDVAIKLCTTAASAPQLVAGRHRLSGSDPRERYTLNSSWRGGGGSGGGGGGTRTLSNRSEGRGVFWDPRDIFELLSAAVTALELAEEYGSNSTGAASTGGDVMTAGRTAANDAAPAVAGTYGSSSPGIGSVMEGAKGPDGGARPPAQLVLALLLRLRSRLHVRGGGAGQDDGVPDAVLVGCLWALAKLRYQPPEPLLRDMLTAARGRLTRLAPDQLAQLMWALAALTDPRDSPGALLQLAPGFRRRVRVALDRVCDRGEAATATATAAATVVPNAAVATAASGSPVEMAAVAAVAPKIQEPVRRASPKTSERLGASPARQETPPPRTCKEAAAGVQTLEAWGSSAGDESSMQASLNPSGETTRGSVPLSADTANARAMAAPLSTRGLVQLLTALRALGLAPPRPLLRRIGVNLVAPAVRQLRREAVTAAAATRTTGSPSYPSYVLRQLGVVMTALAGLRQAARRTAAASLTGRRRTRGSIVLRRSGDGCGGLRTEGNGLRRALCTTAARAVARAVQGRRQRRRSNQDVTSDRDGDRSDGGRFAGGGGVGDAVYDAVRPRDVCCVLAGFRRLGVPPPPDLAAGLVRLLSGREQLAQLETSCSARELVNLAFELSYIANNQQRPSSSSRRRRAQENKARWWLRLRRRVRQGPHESTASGQLGAVPAGATRTGSLGGQCGVPAGAPHEVVSLRQECQTVVPALLRGVRRLTKEGSRVYGSRRSRGVDGGDGGRVTAPAAPAGGMFSVRQTAVLVAAMRRLGMGQEVGVKGPLTWSSGVLTLLRTATLATAVAGSVGGGGGGHGQREGRGPLAPAQAPAANTGIVRVEGIRDVVRLVVAVADVLPVLPVEKHPAAGSTAVMQPRLPASHSVGQAPSDEAAVEVVAVAASVAATEEAVKAAATTAADDAAMAAEVAELLVVVAAAARSAMAAASSETLVAEVVPAVGALWEAAIRAPWLRDVAQNTVAATLAACCRTLASDPPLPYICRLLDSLLPLLTTTTPSTSSTATDDPTTSAPSDPPLLKDGHHCQLPQSPALTLDPNLYDNLWHAVYRASYRAMAAATLPYQPAAVAAVTTTAEFDRVSDVLAPSPSRPPSHASPSSHIHHAAASLSLTPVRQQLGSGGGGGGIDGGGGGSSGVGAAQLVALAYCLARHAPPVAPPQSWMERLLAGIEADLGSLGARPCARLCVALVRLGWVPGGGWLAAFGRQVALSAALTERAEHELLSEAWLGLRRMGERGEGRG